MTSARGDAARKWPAFSFFVSCINEGAFSSRRGALLSRSNMSLNSLTLLHTTFAPGAIHYSQAGAGTSRSPGVSPRSDGANNQGARRMLDVTVAAARESCFAYMGGGGLHRRAGVGLIN